jgi:hypothetical protein
MLWLESIIGTALWCWWQVPTELPRLRTDPKMIGLY